MTKSTKKKLKNKNVNLSKLLPFQSKNKKIKKERKKLPWASWWCLELQLGF